jgi:hypothetical protein
MNLFSVEVRVDFVEFQLASQDRLGRCQNQFLTIPGVDSPLCGNNKAIEWQTYEKCFKKLTYSAQ